MGIKDIKHTKHIDDIDMHTDLLVPMCQLLNATMENRGDTDKQKIIIEAQAILIAYGENDMFNA